MKAIDFVKEYGLDYSKRILEVAPTSANFVEWYPLQSRFYITDFGCNRAVLLAELEQIVDAWKLVERFGGLEESKKLHYDEFRSDNTWGNLQQAIIRVEQCQ